MALDLRIRDVKEWKVQSDEGMQNTCEKTAKEGKKEDGKKEESNKSGMWSSLELSTELSAFHATSRFSRGCRRRVIGIHGFYAYSQARKATLYTASLDKLESSWTECWGMLVGYTMH